MKKRARNFNSRLLSMILSVALLLPALVVPSAAWSGTPLWNQASVYLNGKIVASPNEDFLSVLDVFFPSSVLCGNMVYLPLETLIGCGISLDLNADNSVTINSVDLHDPILRERRPNSGHHTSNTFLANVSSITVAGRKIVQAQQNLIYGGESYPSSFFDGGPFYLPITPILEAFGIHSRWDSQTSTLYLNESAPAVQNKVMSVSTNSMVIDKTSALTVTLLVDDYVNFQILGDGTNIIRAEWSGNWQQNQTSLMITPKKSGTATIRITNDYNSECEYVSVTVDLSTRTVGLSNFKKSNVYNAGQFSDVSSSAWYADKIKAAYEYGLVSGTNNGLFQPTRNISIIEAIIIATRLHSIYYSNDETFQGNGVWYQPYVDYALANHIIAKPYPNQDAAISRGEFAILMSNAFPDTALAQINTIPDNAIPDVAAGSSCGSAVYRLYRAGIISGVNSAGEFRPDAQITRAEAATIMGNMVDTSLRKTFTLEIPTTPMPPANVPINSEAPYELKKQIAGELITGLSVFGAGQDCVSRAAEYWGAAPNASVAELCKQSQPLYKIAADSLKKASNMCGDYADVQELKTALLNLCSELSIRCEYTINEETFVDYLMRDVYDKTLINSLSLMNQIAEEWTVKYN